MMGQEVLDPYHAEGEIERMPGLGLLPVTTTIEGEKVTRQVRFTLPQRLLHASTPPEWMEGYEIHMGTTVLTGGTDRLFEIKLAPECRQGNCSFGEAGVGYSEKCLGTYIHGILDNKAFVDMLLAPYAEKIKQGGRPIDYHAFKKQQYDLLADHVRRHVDMGRIYQILTGDD